MISSLDCRGRGVRSPLAASVCAALPTAVNRRHVMKMAVVASHTLCPERNALVTWKVFEQQYVLLASSLL